MTVKGTLFRKWISPWVAGARAAAQVLRNSEELTSQAKKISEKLSPSQREHVEKVMDYMGKLARMFVERYEIETGFETESIAAAKQEIVSALSRKAPPEKAEIFDQIIDEALDIAREYDRSVPHEVFLYNARKIKDLKGTVLATVAVLLQNIPLESLKKELMKREGSMLFDLKDSIIDVLGRFEEIKDFEISIEKAKEDPRYIESKMKELVRRCGDYETFLIFFFNRLQEARKLPPGSDNPLRDQLRYFYAPLAEMVQLIYLADDFKDQYLRIKDINTYKHIEVNVVKNRTGMTYDEAKRFLKSFAAKLIKQLKRDHPELLSETSFFWRVKSPFSIYSKVKANKKKDPDYDYDMVRDILGFKGVCESNLGPAIIADAIQQHYDLDKDGYDNNISKPRESGFRAITLVILAEPNGVPFRVPIEIQLMTEEMDYHNTFLKPAHWKYKIENELEEAGIKQEFDVRVLEKVLNRDPEKNFYRLNRHWAAI